VLPSWFTSDAADAHAKLLTLIVTERYLELPCREGGWPIPLRSETVRRVCVWEGTTDA
jgi:hypothetical protein